MYNAGTMDTDIRHKALEVLKGAEQSLRKLISQAALEQHYDEVAWIVELAKQVSEVRARNANASPQMTPSANTLEASNTSTSTAAVTKSKRGTTTTKSGNYPRFRSQDYKLIKTGWSKKNKTEYEHRAPRDAVEKIFGVISQVSKYGSFDVEAISPPATEGDELIPSYQIYLAIGWLRDSGYLEKCGRNEYAVADAAGEVDFQSLWQNLPRI